MRGVSYKRIKRGELLSFFKIADKLYKKRGRGRKREYKESFILFALAYKILRGLSMRELVYELEELFDKSPALSTLHYRFQKVDLGLVNVLIGLLAKELKRRCKDCRLFIIDGTGFGYLGSYCIEHKRGEEIKEIKNHKKAVVLVRTGDEEMAIVEGVNIGRAYSNERELALPLLQRRFPHQSYLLGDKFYGMSSDFAHYLLSKKSITPVIAVSDTFRQKVKNIQRLALKKLYEENKNLYSKRYKIEQLFANIKNAYGDKNLVFLDSLATLYTLMKFLLYNLALLFLAFLLFSNTLIFCISVFEKKILKLGV